MRLNLAAVAHRRRGHRGARVQRVVNNCSLRGPFQRSYLPTVTNRAAHRPTLTHQNCICSAAPPGTSHPIGRGRCAVDRADRNRTGTGAGHHRHHRCDGAGGGDAGCCCRCDDASPMPGRCGRRGRRDRRGRRGRRARNADRFANCSGRCHCRPACRCTRCPGCRHDSTHGCRGRCRRRAPLSVTDCGCGTDDCSGDCCAYRDR